MGGDVKLRYEGLLKERMASGRYRYRVRVEGDPKRRIPLSVTPDHPDFHQFYTAARRGIRLFPEKETTVTRGTVEWLARGYLSHLEQMVETGSASPLTLRQRRSHVELILNQKSTSQRSAGRVWAGLPMMIPQSEMLAMRDSLMATPGKAKNVCKTLKAIYAWGVEYEKCEGNPAAGIKVDYSSQGGAVPWTLEDLDKYRKAHPPGTKAHLALSLFMFTACRIGDAYKLGRDHEVTRNGETWLAWKPGKKGSKAVEVPMLPPLKAAIQAQTVVGPAYLLTEHGKPFASMEALRNRFKKWCVTAGLPDRSSHGIRKAAGHLMALNGATQYEIMSVHGHANASTSEVYTQSVERMRLAGLAASRLADMEW